MRVEGPLTLTDKGKSTSKIGISKLQAEKDHLTAVIICHGMGQQVKFETLGQLGDMLKKKSSKNDSNDIARMVRFNGKTFPRVELNLHNGNEERKVHLFEVFWAPLTEGKVNLIDVVKFLFSAAGRGFSYCFKKDFKLWMFSGLKKLSFPRIRNFFSLSLVSILILFFAAVCSYAALFIGFKVADKLVTIWMMIRIMKYLEAINIILRYISETLYSNPLNLLYLAGFGISIFLLLWIRKILIEFPGDICAYISSHKLNKFYELRDIIQEKALEVARTVYCSRNDLTGEYIYDSVIVVGHSLGSVIAYDMLNKTISENVAEGNPVNVADRTKMLLTFGSPLDKTAFLFRTLTHNSWTREMLASAVQPLITDYAFRPDNWINIYSRCDIISGPLNYYDDPENNHEVNNKRVQNVIDRKAKMPIVAHVQYWKNDEVPDRIFKSIFS